MLIERTDAEGMGMPESEDRIDLSQAIRELRSQLESAINAGEGESLQFESTEVKLELKVGLTKSGEGSGGINFQVLSLGGKRSYATESLQTISLCLKPIRAGYSSVRIGRDQNQSPLDSTRDEQPREMRRGEAVHGGIIPSS